MYWAEVQQLEFLQDILELFIIYNLHFKILFWFALLLPQNQT